MRYSNTDFFFDEAENDSDSDHDRFGAVKKVPEITKLVEKWKQPSKATPTNPQQEALINAASESRPGASLHLS